MAVRSRDLIRPEEYSRNHKDMPPDRQTYKTTAATIIDAHRSGLVPSHFEEERTEMRRKIFLLAAGVAIFFLAYGPININVTIDTSPDGSGDAMAATRNGTEADDALSGTTYRDFMEGLGGNDTLRGGYGKDIVTGGAGDDTLYGDQDGDNIVGHEGVDKIYGGSGDDVIIAMDGEEDIVDCGSGNGDFVFTDGVDKLVNCENVSNRWFMIQGT